MQRKTVNRTKEGEKMGKLPFQFKRDPRNVDFETAQQALPFFGGVEEESTESAVDDTSAASTPESVTTEPVVSSESATNSELSPEQIADLMKQVAESNKRLSEVNTKLSEYESKEKNAARAQQTREQVLEQDLNDAQQTIARMDSVIRQTALINAIQGAKDIEFHSAKHVLRELDPNVVDLDVDLENGTATVTGIDAELKRIARECDWLVKKNGIPTQGIEKRAPRGSGAPPSSPNGSNDKASRRQELVNRYPVISHGRAV